MKRKSVDAKAPCLMVMPIAVQFGDKLSEKPVFLHPVGGEVWVTDFDTFMDAGFEVEHRIIPIDTNEGYGASQTVALAWDYLTHCISEFGEPTSVTDIIDRAAAFSALWKFKTGDDIVFK